jgi:cytochrome c biogenesis protein CcdA
MIHNTLVLIAIVAASLFVPFCCWSLGLRPRKDFREWWGAYGEGIAMLVGVLLVIIAIFRHWMYDF